MAGTSEGGKKAAQKIGHEKLSKAGQKGGKHSHGRQSRSKQPKRNESRTQRK